MFNDNLAGVANSILSLAGQQTSLRPWSNFMVMEILVAVFTVTLFTLLRSSLSVDKPGSLQHLVEVVYDFLRGQTEEAAGHHTLKHLPFFASLFFFILFCNLIGIIPGFESPTMFPAVTLGCALVSFLYFNVVGVQSQGLFGYLKHFTGGQGFPMALLMVPIEIVSTLARPLSLTIRLYANMLAGEKVTLVFLGLTYLVAPALFMGLHLFVSFLQAYVFIILTMMYVGGASEHHASHGDEPGANAGHHH
ncbi:MAG: F0F1 ATP synthase subunit A [Bryobacteraceae bacterium]|nr:F0F1 ATP synthase subunit A [Bryobacteraceae bacterium]